MVRRIPTKLEWPITLTKFRLGVWFTYGMKLNSHSTIHGFVHSITIEKEFISILSSFLRKTKLSPYSLTDLPRPIWTFDYYRLLSTTIDLSCLPLIWTADHHSESLPTTTDMNHHRPPSVWWDWNVKFHWQNFIHLFDSFFFMEGIFEFQKIPQMKEFDIFSN